MNHIKSVVKSCALLVVPIIAYSVGAIQGQHEALEFDVQRDTNSLGIDVVCRHGSAFVTVPSLGPGPSAFVSIEVPPLVDGRSPVTCSGAGYRVGDRDLSREEIKAHASRTLYHAWSITQSSGGGGIPVIDYSRLDQAQRDLLEKRGS